MFQYQGDEVEYVADDNEMAEMEDDMYFRGRVLGDSNSYEEDDDEYDPLENRITDTPASEAKRGKDVQGSWPCFRCGNNGCQASFNRGSNHNNSICLNWWILCAQSAILYGVDQIYIYNLVLAYLALRRIKG